MMLALGWYIAGLQPAGFIAACFQGDALRHADVVTGDESVACLFPRQPIHDDKAVMNGAPK